MSTIETNGNEIVQGIDKLLDDLTVQPGKFATNIGKLYAQFNHRQRMIKIMAELKGHFIIEFDVDVNQFAKDPEAAFNAVHESVSDFMFAAMQRRHNERSVIAGVMKEFQQ